MAKTLTAAVQKLKRVDPGLTDLDLLDRHAAGDPDAFAALVRRHGKSVLAACRQVLTDPADIDDAFQATFVVLLKKVKMVAWQASLSSWLYAVAHRVAVHARGDQVRRTVQEAEAGRRKAAVPPDLSWRDAVGVLHEELDKLPERYRRVLLLCYLNGQSRDEAAANLGVKPGAVKGCLERGRALLAARLTKRGVALSAGLLAVLAGNSVAAAGGPSVALIDSTVRAGGGDIHPAVSALVNGAFPMSFAAGKSWVMAVVVSAVVAAGFWLSSASVTATDPPAKTKQAAKKTDGASATDQEPTTIRGSVVGPDGKPVNGAKVWLVRSGDAIFPKLPAPRHAATTDQDGRFVVSRKADDEPLRWSVIAATKVGFGPGITRADTDPDDKSALRCSLNLVKDDVPLEGRVLDLQGKPVVGAVVRPVVLHRTDAPNLDEWETAARRSTKEAASEFRSFFPHSVRLKDGAIGGIAGEVKTDKDGNFTITGLGRDRLVTLRVSGPGIATTEFDAVTRVMTTIRTPQDKLKSQYNPRTYHGAKVEFSVEPSQPFTGVVTDQETGRPVPGVIIKRRMGWDESVQAVTDAAGKYRLDGLRTGEQELVAIPPLDAPYHLRVFRAGRPANDQPVHANVELIRGVWVSGTVTDKATGKPVAASLVYRPYDTAADLIPGYTPRGLDDTTWFVTDKNGRFRVLAVPGQGFVLVRAFDRYLTADQVDWQGDLTKTAPQPYVDSAPVEIASNWNAVGLVTVADGKPAKEYAFTVEPGVTLKTRIIDPDGKPLAGCAVTQRTNFSPFEVGQADTADVTFDRVNPKRPRPVLVLHRDKHLGVMFSTKSDGQGATDIRLQPTATARGRLLNEDGKPMPNTPIEIRYTLTEEVGWRTTKLYPEVTTDQDGRFVIPNLISGVKYELRWPRPAVKRANGYHGFEVTGGAIKDLGDVSAKRDD